MFLSLSSEDAFSTMRWGAAARSLRDTAQCGEHGWVAAMSVLGASRFTVMLAAIAIFGTAGSFWWAIETRTGLKSGATYRLANQAAPSKPASRGLRPKDERSNKFVFFDENQRSQPSPAGWSENRDPLPERSASPPVYVNYVNPGLPIGGANMPLPIPPAQSDAESQAKAPEASVFVPPLPAENPKRQTRDPKPEPAVAATSNSTKPPARTYYTEKIVEQGDAGEIKYRYRRQPCEPPNMPDVCFMPQSSRRNIVVERR